MKNEWKYSNLERNFKSFGTVNFTKIIFSEKKIQRQKFFFKFEKFPKIWKIHNKNQNILDKLKKKFSLIYFFHIALKNLKKKNSIEMFRKIGKMTEWKNKTTPKIKKVSETRKKIKKNIFFWNSRNKKIRISMIEFFEIFFRESIFLVSTLLKNPISSKIIFLK